MKHLLTLAALLALSSPVVADEAPTAPATPPAKAAAPAAPAKPVGAPVIFNSSATLVVREINVDQTISCRLDDAILTCSARRAAPVAAPKPVAK